MGDSEDPVFLSVLRVPTFCLEAGGDSGGGEWTRVLRSVLMKPEHEREIEHLHERIEHFARKGASAEAPTT